jgi:hypothetical protein
VEFLDKNIENMTREELLLWNLIRAEQHCSQALQLVYDPLGVRRNVWFRLRLLKSQSNLMTLLVRELNRKNDVKKEKDGE